MGAHHSAPGLRSTPQGFPPGYRVTCCRCGYWTDISVTNLSGGLPDEVIRRKIRQRGWDPGKDFTRSLCAKCAEADTRRKPRHAAVIEAVPYHEAPVTAIPTIVPTQDPKPMTLSATPGPNDLGNVTQIRVDPPRSMTKADRQIIFAKLQDTYPLTDAGYVEGWTDERVARDLGVPRAWVTLIRDENFGPQILGPTVEEQFAAYRAQAETELAGLRDRLAALQGSINAASRDAAAMAAVLEAASRRITTKQEKAS